MRIPAIAATSLAMVLALQNLSIAQEKTLPTKKSLTEWIEVLKDKANPYARLKARKALGPTGLYANVAVLALINAFAEENPRVDYEAAAALADYGPGVVPTLLLALKRPEAPVRAVVAEALGHVRPKATDAVPALASCFCSVRNWSEIQSRSA